MQCNDLESIKSVGNNVLTANATLFKSNSYKAKLKCSTYGGDYK